MLRLWLLVATLWSPFNNGAVADHRQGPANQTHLSRFRYLYFAFHALFVPTTSLARRETLLTENMPSFNIAICMP